MFTVHRVVSYLCIKGRSVQVSCSTVNCKDNITIRDLLYDSDSRLFRIAFVALTIQHIIYDFTQIFVLGSTVISFLDIVLYYIESLMSLHSLVPCFNTSVYCYLLSHF